MPVYCVLYCDFAQTHLLHAGEQLAAGCVEENKQTEIKLIQRVHVRQPRDLQPQPETDKKLQKQLARVHHTQETLVFYIRPDSVLPTGISTYFFHQEGLAAQKSHRIYIYCELPTCLVDPIHRT